MKRILLLLVTMLAGMCGCCAWAQQAPVAEGDFNVHDFHFASGETLPNLRLHFRTLGEPQRGANGLVDNAVLLLHATGGNGGQFLQPQFAGVLFGKGQLLDTAKYYIILPDDIGHGRSSKPSDGLRARFPSYDYDDMVAAQHLLLTQALGVDHLRLILGTSMGCMQAWVWGETYPGFTDALMPLACLPVQIAGRNRMMRKMAMDAIRDDPAWNHGNYKIEPPGLKTAVEMTFIMDSSPLRLQQAYPTRDQADAYLEKTIQKQLAATDANDFLYQFNASRNYDPSIKLDRIQIPVMAVNSADDFINPPELNIMPEMIKKVPRGKFVLLPISAETHGHGTHTFAALWQNYLAELLQESESGK